MNFLTLLLWLTVGVFISGLVEGIKKSPTIPLISNRQNWRIHALSLFLCTVTFIFVNFLRSADDSYVYLIFLYCATEVAFSHIFHPLDKFVMRGHSR